MFSKTLVLKSTVVLFVLRQCKKKRSSAYKGAALESVSWEARTREHAKHIHTRVHTTHAHRNTQDTQTRTRHTHSELKQVQLQCSAKVMILSRRRLAFPSFLLGGTQATHIYIYIYIYWLNAKKCVEELKINVCDSRSMALHRAHDSFSFISLHVFLKD